MPTSSERGVCVCYVHGLDRRLIDAHDTPFLARLMTDDRVVIVDPMPSNELVSTVFTGAWPQQHGRWQVSLSGPPRPRRAHQRLVDLLPDFIATTCQCLRYQFDRGFELPTVPPRRRRRFTFHRFKYYRWALAGSGPREVGGCATFFGVLGDRCRFHFAADMTQTRRALAGIPTGAAVDFVQSYGFDQLEHWNLDRPQVVRQGMRDLDRWLADAAHRCAQAHADLLIFSDHGQEPVTGHIDLKRRLKQTGVSQNDYTFYIEAQCARFWFHTAQARDRITAAIDAIDHTQTIDNQGLRAFGLDFADNRYGDLYLFTRQGHIFFPHDFHHPLANLIMGLTEYEVMSPRLRDPRQRGYHGHLPPHPAEVGFMVMTDDRHPPLTRHAKLIDVAPTILALAGAQPSPTMHGHPAFTNDRRAT